MTRLDAGRWIRFFAVPGLIAAYGILMSITTVMKHLSLNSYGCDLGIFDNVMWNTVHGRVLYSSILERNILGEHAAPILLLLAPIYALWQDPKWLLILQSLALAAAAIPIFRLADRRLGLAGGLVVLLAYFFYRPLHSVNLFDFHEIALAVPLLAFAYLCLEERQPVRFVVLLGLALLCKEEMALVVGAFGVSLLLFGPYRRLGAVLVLSGAVVFLFETTVMIPYFRRAPFSFLDRYSYLGTSLPEIARNLLQQPHLALESLQLPGKAPFFVELFYPVLFLPWLSPPDILLILPTLARILLSNHEPQYSLVFHFPAPLIPFVFFGAIRVLGWLRSLRFAWAREAFHFVLLVLLGVNLLAGSNPLDLPGRYADVHRSNELDALAAQIPSGASLSAHNRLVPHVAHRDHISVYPTLNDADYVLLDYGRLSREYPMHPEEDRQLFLRLIASGRYGIVDCRDKRVLLKRGAQSTPEDVADLADRLFLRFDRKQFDSFGLVAKLASNQMFPPGKYDVSFTLRRKKNSPPSSWVLLTVHPYRGEFLGEWTLAQQRLDSDALSSLPGDEVTLTLPFTNPSYSMLSFQLVNVPEEDPVEIVSARVTPRFPLRTFVRNLMTHGTRDAGDPLPSTEPIHEKRSP